MVFVSAVSFAEGASSAAILLGILPVAEFFWWHKVAQMIF
jgi:hypothetical protein